MKTRNPLFARSGMLIIILTVIAFVMPREFIFSQETTPFSKKHENATDFTVNPLPPGWDFTEAGDPHGIIVMLAANPRINDIPILPGDYIGAFYEDDNGDLKCGGADYWLGDENIIFGVFGDNPNTPEKDGFSFAEQEHYKLYSYTTLKEYDIDLITFDPSTYTGTDIWYPLSISQVINMASLVDFDAYALATPNPVCIGNSVNLEANIFIGTTGNYTYSWTSDPAGFTSTLQNPTVTPGESITYFLEVSDGTLFSEAEANVIVNFPATIVAGSDGTICEDEQAHLSAVATNYGGILWTTAGDGTFDDPEDLNPFYSPGPLDAQNGFAGLSVVALPLDDCVLAPSDELTVTVSRLPNLSLPSSTGFCETQQIWITADIDVYSSLAWTTSGDGTFSDPNSPTTQYFPGSFDLSLRDFTLTCCADAASPCSGTECQQMYCELSAPSTVNAPGSRTACENLPVPLISVAFNYSSVLWTTEGDGYFENQEALSTNYIPGPLDIENGGTVVTINAFGFDACLENPAQKNVNVIVKPLPKVDAGDINVICGSQPIQINGSVEDYLSFQWSTSGDGYFNSVVVQSPIYYPGSNDIASGFFELTLTAQPNSPCVGAVSDVLEIELVDQAQVEISTPSDQILCAGINLQLEALAGGYTGILWETSGDGYFDDPTLLTAIYFHGPVTDLNGNPVTLKITAFASPACGTDVSDEIIVTYAEEASSTAGEDFAACADDLFVTGVAENYESVEWESDGDGYFVEPGSLATQYIPGSGDLSSGSAELCLIAFGFGECPDVSDCLTVSIYANPIAVAGDDATIIETQTFITDGNAENYSIFSWSTSGDGTFAEPSLLATEYIPGQQDIQNELVELTLTAYPLSPSCSDPAVSTLTLTIMRQQNIEFQTGWNGFSSFVDPPDPAFDEVVSLISGQLEFAQNMTEVYWPEYGINTIGEFKNDKGYKVKLNANASLPITGFAETNKTVSIPEGWSTLPVISDCVMPYTELIAQLADKLIAVTEIGGTGMLYPGQGIYNLPELEPGKAYSIKMTEGADFTFPGCLK
jgi:hypothetical protein